MAVVTLYLDTDHKNDTGIVVVSHDANAFDTAIEVAKEALQNELLRVQGNYPGKAEVRWLDGTKPAQKHTACVFLNPQYKASEFILVLKNCIEAKFEGTGDRVVITN